MRLSEVIKTRHPCAKAGSAAGPLASVGMPGTAFCVVCVLILLLVCRTRPEDRLNRPQSSGYDDISLANVIRLSPTPNLTNTH